MPDKYKEKQLHITSAPNGGYSVQMCADDYRQTSELVGAYSNIADLVEALPGLLGAGVDFPPLPQTSDNIMDEIHRQRVAATGINNEQLGKGPSK